MKLKSLFFALPALLTLTLVAAPRVEAQGFPGMGGMKQMFKGGKETQNPAVSAVGALLDRNDVKTEITLSQRQAEQMTAQRDQAIQQIGDKIKENLPDFKSIMSLSDDERATKINETITKVQDVVQTQANVAMEASEKKAQEILKPEQWKRLQELDLQWRGPLALAEPKLAEKFQLTADQKSKILALNNDYQKQRQQAVQNIFSGFSSIKLNDGPPDMDAIKAKMAKAQEDMTKAQKESEKFRKAQEEKVLPLLTDSQKAAWTAAQGVPFKFRTAE